MSKPLTSVHECEWEQEQLDNRIRAFLRSRGWAYTCEYASIWLFTKEVEGAFLACQQDTALVIEEWVMDMEPCPRCGGSGKAWPVGDCGPETPMQPCPKCGGAE